jgi:ZIP family zinc transporter
VLVATATGIVEPPATIAAYAAFEYAEALVPLWLSFAAGAILYVVVDELIPESHLRDNEQIASVSVLGASG